jgi:Yip1-like protein
MITDIPIEVRAGVSKQWIRIGDLFFAPTRVFNDILRDRSWWLPFLLTVVCSYTLTFSAAYKIGFRQLSVNIMRADPASAADYEDMSPEQKNSILSTTETAFEISAFSTPALIILFNAIYALVLWISMNLGVKGRAEFSSIFAVLLYADLIQNIRAILATIFVYLTADPAAFNISNPIGTNPGYYLDLDSAGWLRTVLGATDLITFWYLALIALGCSIVAKVSRRASFGVVFGLWLLIVITRVMWVAIT